jgi:predicted transglutaminase-like cysteine proteinase
VGKLWILATSVFAAGCFSLAMASAIEKPKSQAADELDGAVPTSAPAALLDFCKREAQECEPRNLSQGKGQLLNASQWMLVQTINVEVNRRIQTADDRDIYGRDEFWAMPMDRGDCEDYAILKRHLLREGGLDDASLLITVVRDEKGEGHAVLTLAMIDGDYILDNRRDVILPAELTGYEFLKRQSQDNPREWVSLAKPQAGDVASLQANSHP